MDLSGPARCARALLALAPVLAGCSNPAFELSESAIRLPATLREAYPLARDLAGEWSDAAILTGIGGGFTVMDSSGRSLNHTFRFQSQVGFGHRELTVHLLSGTPWSLDTPAPANPQPLPDLETIVDSDVAVRAAINLAEAANATLPDSIPIPQEFAARLLGSAVWPEPDPANEIFPEAVAWRVDFLVLDVLEETQSLVWWSTARFYLDPRTAEALGEPVVPETGREIYPYP